MQYGIAFTPLVPTLVLWIALAAITTIAASAIHSTIVGTRGVNAMPYCMLYCPNRSIRAGAWT